MNEAIFEYFANKDWANHHFSHLQSKIWSMPRKALVDAIDELEALIPEPTGKAASPFEFLASGALSGGRSPCVAFECRTERLRELAYFSALYADKVWFPSPFAPLRGVKELDSLRGEFLFYVHRLQRLQPLFHYGVMELTPSHRGNLCSHCYANLIAKSQGGFKERFGLLTSELNARYETDVKFFGAQTDDEVVLTAEGPSKLVDEHLGAYVVYKPTGSLSRLLRKRSKSGAPIPLSQAVVRKHKLARLLYEDVLADIVSQNYYSTTYGTGYLTQRPLDFELISALSPKPLRDTNALLNTNFAHELPVVGGMSLRALVAIRETEGEAFQVYRDALTKAVGEVRGQDGRMMSQAFRDVVKPEINRVNAALASARKRLTRDALVNASIATGVVGVGLFTGILPANIALVVSALGGYHFFQKAGAQAAALALEPLDLRANSFYFLWKVQKHGQRGAPIARDAGDL